jgi:quinol monooxygenase YgiN
MIVVAKLKAKEGGAGEMEKALTDMVAKVEKEEGTLVYTLHRHKKDPTVFLVYEKYKNKEAFKYHSSTSHMKQLFSILQPLLAGEPAIEIYDEIARLNK